MESQIARTSRSASEMETQIAKTLQNERKGKPDESEMEIYNVIIITKL